MCAWGAHQLTKFIYILIGLAASCTVVYIVTLICESYRRRLLVSQLESHGALIVWSNNRTEPNSFTCKPIAVIVDGWLKGSELLSTTDFLAIQELRSVRELTFSDVPVDIACLERTLRNSPHIRSVRLSMCEDYESLRVAMVTKFPEVEFECLDNPKNDPTSDNDRPPER
jgi:hypothetical protein